MNYEFRKMPTLLGSLTVYRGLLQDDLIKAYYFAIRNMTGADANLDQFVNSYSDFFYRLVEHSPVISFADYLIEKIVYDNNAFSKESEKVEFSDIGDGLKKAALNDLVVLEKVAGFTARDIKKQALEMFKENGFVSDLIANLPEWENESKANEKIPRLFQAGNNPEENLKSLADFHRLNGVGEFAKYIGFVWERGEQKGNLKGVSHTDPIQLKDLISYDRERERVITNTLQFLNGSPANNVLLYGDRGTGKSSTVKALLNEYNHQGLRVIELPKTHLGDLHDVLRLIKERAQKFIIFVDDLSFDDDEREYTALKAVLEGSLECKPDNVVIYATSNRRHLIKERFSDRAGLVSGNRDDEVHAGDTMQEKLSLADRFGITVTFSLPDQKRYLKIVEGLAASRNIDIDTKTLHQEALRWEMYYNGRSPRTARQFVDWLEGKLDEQNSN